MSQRPEPRRPAPKVVEVTIGDPARHTGRLKELGGSRSDDWNNQITNDTIQTLWLKNSDKATRDRQTLAVIEGLIGIAPRDELEGMMAAQLIAAHNAAMECYRRAMIGEQTFEGRRESLNRANRLSRTFTQLIDALNRQRGKGQQKVTVEHVHVHSGGQAVVGVVEPTGGGHRSKPEEQSRAEQIAYAPEPAMRSAHEEREAVPLAGDAEWPVPHARRTIARSAEGK
jgi:hypothetical protein